LKKGKFDQWLDLMKSSIYNYSYYTDFDKVDRNIEEIYTELSYLNILAGMKTGIEQTFRTIVINHNEVIKCLPRLLATRQERLITINSSIDFSGFNQPLDDYVNFMKKSGLFDLISSLDKNSLVSYVRGVEVGMDSHARKNRVGHLMEDIVEHYIKQAGFKYGVNYFKEMNSKQLIDKFKIDSSDLFATDVNKRFDFVVVGKNKKLYLIETNFYGCKSGSKTAEIARDYSRAFDVANKITSFEFVWITDGQCWKTYKNDLQPVYSKTNYLFHIKDMEDGKLKKKLK
jgi:type II restriction enzyme